MSSYLIDLTKAPFWIAFVVAVILLAPMARGQSRSPLFALINIGFIAALMGWRAGATVFVAAVIARVLAWASHRTRHAFIWVLIGGFMALALFLLHKLPNVAQALGTHDLNPILSVIGFSYVFLRLTRTAARDVQSSATSRPNLVATINYLLPFHMLAAGPITSLTTNSSPYQQAPVSTTVMALEAVERIAFGLFKPVRAGLFGIQKLFPDRLHGGRDLLDLRGADVLHLALS